MGNLWAMRVGSGNGRGMSLATERKPFANGNERVSRGEQEGIIELLMK